MSETPTTRTPGRPNRGLRIALILSLALNLMLIGVMAGGVLRYSHRPPTPTMQTDYRSLWRALPAEVRSELRAAARENGFPGDRSTRLSPDERRARVAQMNAGFIDQLRTEPFDAEAFAALLDEEPQAVSRRMQAARAAFVARVAELSTSERAAMARALEQAWEDRLPRR